MRVGYADHAGVAGRRGYAPATQARCDGEGGTSHQTQSSKRVRAKLMPLPSYRKRIFECCQGQALRRASATLTEIEYPLLVKRVFSHPLPPPRLRRRFPTATAADASRLCRPRRRRRPSGLRARYAGALRRGGGGTSHQTQSSKRVRAKLMPLPLIASVFFGVLSRSSPSARKRDLDRDRIPAFSKAGIQPSPSRHRGYAASSPPTATAADASRLCRPRRRRRPSGLRARYAGALRRGGRDFTPNAVFQEGKGKTDALTLLSQAYFSSAVKVKLFRRASATLTEIEYPLLVKRVFSHPPATAATPLLPRRPPPPMRRLCRPRRRRRPSGLRARYAGALRRGGRDFTPNAVSKRVRAKLMPLPSYRKRIFLSAVKVKPFGAQARP